MDITKLRQRFHQHRHRAEKRGIPFRLTFDEWYGIWESSGHLHHRGRSSDQYCMARHSDKGAYEIGNVSIVTIHANAVERNRTSPRPKSGGRPRTVSGDTQAPAISVRLPVETVSKLNAMAFERGVRRSEMLRQLVINAIRRLER